MTTYNISINDELAVLVEKAMKKGRYANRSEFFRDLVRRFSSCLIEECIIEQLSPSDPDYKYIEKREKDAEFISIDELKKELNV